MLRTLLVCASLSAVIAPAAAAQAPAPAKAASERAERAESNTRAYVELLRTDIRAEKVAILTEMMEFTEAEDTKFWPIYREYDVEMAKINDERVSAIAEYAEHYQKVTDALADKLALKALELEGRRTALKTKYYTRLKSTLSPTTAARFLQVENQLLMIVDLQISAVLPVLQ